MTKLVLCLECDGMFAPGSLGYASCSFACEKSRAEWLEDSRTIEIVGNCVAIGLNNSGLDRALERWEETKALPQGTLGRTTGLGFEAFIIPENSQWVKRVPELTSQMRRRAEIREQKRTSAAARRSRIKDTGQ